MFLQKRQLTHRAWAEHTLRFHFNVRHGDEVDDDVEGVEMQDLHTAWKEATRSAGEILKDINGSLEPDIEWRMDVTDGKGQPLFSLRLMSQTYAEGRKLKR